MEALRRYKTTRSKKCLYLWEHTSKENSQLCFVCIQKYIMSGLMIDIFNTNSFFSQVNGDDSYIVVFGGEVDPSDKGHEGAGGFSNDLILISEKTFNVEKISKAMIETDEWPLQRGWSAGCTTSNSGKCRLTVFGGLSGDDNNPQRLNDLWVLSIVPK